MLQWPIFFACKTIDGLRGISDFNLVDKKIHEEIWFDFYNEIYYYWPGWCD